jgi:hypothetical protein
MQNTQNAMTGWCLVVCLFCLCNCVFVVENVVHRCAAGEGSER